MSCSFSSYLSRLTLVALRVSTTCFWGTRDMGCFTGSAAFSGALPAGAALWAGLLPPCWGAAGLLACGAGAGAAFFSAGLAPSAKMTAILETGLCWVRYSKMRLSSRSSSTCI